MFEHLPKVTEEDIEYARDILLPELLERPTGEEKNLDEVMQSVAPELMSNNPFLAEAVARGFSMVAAALKAEASKNTLRIGMCVAQTLLLVLINRKLEEQELNQRLRLEKA